MWALLEDPRFTLKVCAQATKRRERLSGPHLRAHDRAARIGTNGHYRGRRTRWWFPRRQQKPGRGFCEERETTAAKPGTHLLVSGLRNIALTDEPG
jgi:hypothetical protein